MRMIITPLEHIATRITYAGPPTMTEFRHHSSNFHYSHATAQNFILTPRSARKFSLYQPNIVFTRYFRAIALIIHYQVRSRARMPSLPATPDSECH